jgi:hypothetical protein
MSEADRSCYAFLGVQWLNDDVIKVNKTVFAKLLGIKVIDGSLFHQQGNFPSHGFVELGAQNARNFVNPEQLNGVDFDAVRLLIHRNRVFVRGATGAVIEKCTLSRPAKVRATPF